MISCAIVPVTAVLFPSVSLAADGTLVSSRPPGTLFPVSSSGLGMKMAWTPLPR